ncbi:DUF441 domain-containing protein [Desulfallas thermosapovorans]|uniref:UPF0756 membrane protein LX24_02595 n=1 Tax=Desulfallas thermosapovorans DSM 6562 TaxID=1121431 RepID=A0A5S4ZQH7_9FIRM|nr:DUF441 domain-containing protein [Desulfallas thermosapovorans]TYO93795.1 uncharacterized membrane protein (DUF441 family) [Desulfallas thermosapovorans DSM 6562]
MASWGQAGILLLVIILLGIAGHNYVVAVAAGALLALRLLHGEALFPVLEKHALNVGIGVITLAILIPFASGGIGWPEIYRTLASPAGLVALVTGVFVAYLGARGVGYLTVEPQVMVGLMVGTIIGVAFFRGVPVGPLIAAGMVALVMGLLGHGK